MAVKSVHAYIVTPQKGTESPEMPNGGPVSISIELKKTLGDVYKEAKFDSQTPVEFLFDSSRANEFREKIIEYLWGNSNEAGKQIALRLSLKMDKRTEECLLVLTWGELDNGSRQLVIWVFPKEEALQFKAGSTNAINVLEDVFSRTSRLRKAARYCGYNVSASLLGGHVLDFQSSGEGIADYWISEFLLSRLSLNDEAGSRIVGEALEKLYNKIQDRSSREKIYAAIVTLKNKPNVPTRAADIASLFFAGDNAIIGKFKRLFKSDDVYNARFKFSQSAFREVIKLSIYTLENGITVTTPIGISESDLTIKDENNKRKLSATGIIESERIR